MNGSGLGAVPAPQDGGVGARDRDRDRDNDNDHDGDNDGDNDGDSGSGRSPFAEYAWMEHEEEFNRQVEEELQEQEFLDRCFQEMLEEEERDWFIPARDLPQGAPAGEGPGAGDILSKSNLNPDAKEFVPGVKY